MNVACILTTAAVRHWGARQPQLFLLSVLVKHPQTKHPSVQFICCAGAHTWPIVRDRVDAVITVSEAEIAAAMRHVYERMKLAIEPSAAVGVAVLLSAEFKKLPGIRRVGVVLCGGNADVDRLPFVTEAKH